MDNKLKKAIQWTLFILILIFILSLVFIPTVAGLYFPESAIASNSEQFITVVSIMIGFLSTGLSVFSVYQANSGNKQVAQILKTVKSISEYQEVLNSKISEIGTSIGVGKKETTTDKNWPKDNVSE